MVPSRSRSLVFLTILLLLAGIAVLTHQFWMTGLGNALISAEEPSRADMAVVLAGDYFGRRIVRGAELVRKGYVPHVLVSGPQGFYGVAESDVAIAFAVKRGYPESWFISFPNWAHSTEDEAKYILPELRRRKVHSYLLVTSNYHTARAGRVFRRYGPDLDMKVVAAPDGYFRPDRWWHTRQGWKVFYYEWSKTIATAMGL